MMVSLITEMSRNKHFNWGKGQKPFSNAQHNSVGEKKWEISFLTETSEEFLSRYNVIIRLKLSHDIAAFTSTLEKSAMGSVKWLHVARTSVLCLIQKRGGKGCQLSI